MNNSQSSIITEIFVLRIPGINTTGWHGDLENSISVYFLPIYLGSSPLVHKNFYVTQIFSIIQIVSKFINIRIVK